MHSGHHQQQGPDGPGAALSEVPWGLGFPITLTRFAMRFPRSVIIAFALVSIVAAVAATRIKDAVDLLDFIPPNDPDSIVFRDVNKTFGALRVALVGIEAPAGDDVFAPETIRRIAAATEAVKGVHGVDRVVSLSTLPDFVPSDAGVEVQQLVPGPPTSDAERGALRKKVMSRPHVVGNFVAADGSAALMLVFLAQGSNERMVAVAIRKAVAESIGGLRFLTGGAPNNAASIYDETQSDIRRLTPLAIFLILGVILISFRDPVGVVLTILSVVWATLVVIAVMALVGEPFTAASGTLPVILFASGSSYAVHLLGRYYALGGGSSDERGGRHDGKDAATQSAEPRLLTASRIVGPPVAIAGFTTSAGFFSFLVMDIRPMRAFGLECACGVLLCLAASLLLVPAVIAIWPRGASRPADTGAIGAALARVALFARRRWLWVLATSVVLAAATIGPMLRVEVRMEARAFFSPGSEPARAEQFLSEKFGGSEFLTVNLRGDFAEPAALQELKNLELFARSLPGVTQVNSIVEPLTLVNDAMGGGKRLPETRAQVQNLLFFVESDAAVRTVLNPERDQVLVHIRIQRNVHEVVSSVEKYLAQSFNPKPAGLSATVASARLGWIVAAAGGALDEARARSVVAALSLPRDTDARLVDLRRAIAISLVTGEGESLPRRALGDEVALGGAGEAATPVRQIVEELATAGAPGRAHLLALSPSPEEGDLAWKAFVGRVHAAKRKLAVDDAMALLTAPAVPPAASSGIADTLGDLLPERPCAATDKPLTTALSGEPILERAMSRSVGRNQERSLIVSLIAVLLLMGLLFRSAWLSAVSVFPSVLAMATVFGGMGLLGLRLDLGTSLVASIVTGAGSDFAMHYLWYLKRSTVDEVLRFVGPLMVISVCLIAAGFAVLGAGKSQPMRMFGALAAIGMLLAAVLTFLLIPALLRVAQGLAERRRAAAQKAA